MFEALKQQPRGMSPRVRARLFVTMAGILGLGVMAFKGPDLFGGGRAPTPVKLKGVVRSTVGDLDVSGLAGIRANGADPAAFDVRALDAVLKQVARDRFARRTWRAFGYEDRERILSDPSKRDIYRTLRDDVVVSK